MSNQNTTILETKLKRHKISYANENGKIIIGKPKIDYTILLGLVAFPIISSIGLCLVFLFNDFEFLGVHRWKIIASIIFLFGIGFFNLSRVESKMLANDNLKTLEPNIIKIKNESGEYIFDARNIKDFEYSVEQIDEEIYEGNLYLIDMEDRKHQILGFDDENEKYVLDDLKWFSEYLKNHTELKSTANKDLFI